MFLILRGCNHPKRYSNRSSWGALCAVTVGVLLTSCSTTPSPPEMPPPVPEPSEFAPATYYSRVLADAGSYPTLFAPDTFAIWVTDEVVELKKQEALNTGESIDLFTERDAKEIGDYFYVFECHVESVFADSSIAYDVVGFRNVNAYLLLPNGTKVPPLQRIIDGSAEEEQRGALRLFRRANILVFPKSDLFTGEPTIPPASGSARLVLESHGSSFFFQWAAKPVPEEEPASDVPPVSETQKRSALRVRFDELMSKIRALIRIID